MGEARLSFQMTDEPLQSRSNTSWPCSSIFKCLAVNVTVCISSSICTMEISAQDYRRGKVCSVLSLVVIKCIRLISALWVDFMKIQ